MAGDHSDEVDVAFSILPPATRVQIDHAFDLILRSSSNSKSLPPSQRPKGNRDHTGYLESGDELIQPGGFIVGDEPGGFFVEKEETGGFLVDDERDDNTTDEEDTDNPQVNQIPLALIPDALQSLALPPDDEDILAVFRNAASGWSASGRPTLNTGEEGEQFVSRKDWRAVCAALLDTGAADDDDEGSAGRDVDMETHESGGDSGSEDEYEEELSDLSEPPDSEDEYQETGFVSGKAKGKQKAVDHSPSRPSRTSRKKTATHWQPATISDNNDQTQNLRPFKLTARQKAECRRAFSLFFPEVDDNDLESQKIMIKDISRVASLLNEKIKAEEIVEMLEAFSTSRDKSMGLLDFERMMIMAKLA